ncbi:hypothetical protein [Lactococcus formosensis]|uniref:hypothetical protein n=1 Tax=Lactococcus formosensis TaxID=1281486 RepID=UPI002573FC59|nr:hypothetical protein [Lactococcus formosensis]BDX24560.1 hypothetical protein LFMS200408A_06370 [Lactococcus formosensis]
MLKYNEKYSQNTKTLDKENAMLYNPTAQHSTAQHSTAQHSTAQHSTAQHSTAQHSTAQHSTAVVLRLFYYALNGRPG